METAQELRIRLYFQVSIWIKGIISLLEFLSGIIVLIIPPAAITGLVIALAQGELSEEPGNLVAHYSLQLAQHFSFASGAIIATYLITRGLIKLGLVFALLKNQLWAYPASLVVLGLFIIYQAYEFAIGRSALIAMITVFDLVVVYLIWREWRIIREHGGQF